MIMNDYIKEETKYLLHNTFKNQPDQLDIILKELDNSMRNDLVSNFTSQFLKNFLIIIH